jgi:hypothetical protein
MIPDSLDFSPDFGLEVTQFTSQKENVRQFRKGPETDVKKAAKLARSALGGAFGNVSSGRKGGTPCLRGETILFYYGPIVGHPVYCEREFMASNP